MWGQKKERVIKSIYCDLVLYLNSPAVIVIVLDLHQLIHEKDNEFFK